MYRSFFLFPNGSAFSEEEVACIKQAAGPASERTVDWVPVKWGVGAARVLPPRFAPDAAWSIVSAGSSALPWQDRPIRGQLAAQWRWRRPAACAWRRRCEPSQPEAGERTMTTRRRRLLMMTEAVTIDAHEASR